MQQQCERYWHNEHARYADIDVWLDSTHETADVTVRTFRVAKQVLVSLSYIIIIIIIIVVVYYARSTT